MNRLWLSVLLCALCATPVTAQNPRAAKSPQLETTRDKASYAIGLSIGQNMARQGLDLSANLLARGIADALQKRDPLLTPQQLQAAMQAFQREMTAKQDAKGVKNKADGEAFLAKNKKKKGVTTLESGLQFEVLKAGSGPRPKETDTVRTHYHGTLIDGTVFDSSLDGEPATFGVGGVIAGWTEALQLMNVGSKWRLYVPSDLAYGETGYGGSIAPNTTLIFEVELLGIQ
jgi:FKBP-type peptidyl-prolyl cis-trans isomerase FklB